MWVVLGASFFCSGVAALLFESLWFRLAGLAFGNSVWASTLVLASFMGGLALGNGMAARFGHRLRRPVRLYALVELTVAATGLGLVLLLPAGTRIFAPLLRPFLDHPLVLNPLRLFLSSLLLLVPTTAMGFTLPLLVSALGTGAGFGRALGRLYGWNTLGAMVGALSGELFLIRGLGVRGTGVVAAALDVTAAALALALSPRLPAAPAATAGAVSFRSRAWPLFAAAALCGGILLGLEVIWSRFLLLFMAGVSLSFAVMLATVLLGLSAGSLLGAAWLARRPQAHQFLPLLAAAAGAVTLLAYAGFEPMLRWRKEDYAWNFWGTAWLSAWLMLPTCLLSGLLFTLLGRALRAGAEGQAGDEAGIAGALTLSNTLGAMLGAIAAGFVLLPRLGVEWSLFLLGTAYAGVALATTTAAGPARRRALLGGVAALALAVAAFPFGAMQRTFLSRVVRRLAGPGTSVAATREGLTETIVYLRSDLLGRPTEFRLVTNGHSMSGTGVYSQRYMKLYVYWPLALHPRVREALLISYGVGTTARALTDAAEIERIDVVDISRDVVEMSRLVYPGPPGPPVDDPRVRVHIEDGRFFLLTSRERYDLITAEPPPPQFAGVVNLYSREYFALLRERLAEGGVVTYWLPVHQLGAPAAKSIVRGFCDVFEDCSLWTGSGLNWMLVGTRNLRGPVAEAEFTRQWREPAVSASLRAVGLDTPERLGATFLGDSTFVRGLVADTAPLTDDFPYRLSHVMPTARDVQFYADLSDAGRARERFLASPYVRALWPAALRERTPPFFEEVRIFNHHFGVGLSWDRFAALHEALTRTGSYWLPLVVAGSSVREQDIVDEARSAGEAAGAVEYVLGLRALARRDYREADRLFAAVQAREPGFTRVLDFRALALCLAGERTGGLQILGQERYRAHPEVGERPFWAWLSSTCGQ